VKLLIVISERLEHSLIIFRSFIVIFFPRVRNLQILVIKINTKVPEVYFYCGRQYKFRRKLQIFEFKMC